jgi:tetratricopeptide (TPR) repeat protein
MARVEAGKSVGPARPLPEAESLALRAGFHVAMGRAAEARALASQALGLDPGAVAAHEAFALLAWREGRRSEARETLARATSLPGASHYAHYPHGHLLWQSLGGAERLERVEAAFRRSVELSPSFAGAYESLARVRAERGAPLAETLPLALRAARLEPGEFEHSLTALRLAARGRGVQEARAQAAGLLLRDQAEGDDPLVHEGVPLMPTLQLTLTAGAETHVRFYVAIYPAAARSEPVTLTAELLRDGTKVGEGPVELPKPEAGGESPKGLPSTGSR